MKKYVLLFLNLFLLVRISWAQVPVSQEPMHHKVLDNQYVRLLDVHILPGDTTQIHVHATPSVFLVLTAVKTGSEVIQEAEHSMSFTKYGNIYFEDFNKKSRIHRVWNSDDKEFRVMDIELPNKNYQTIDSPIRQAGFNFLFEEKPVRAYRLILASGKRITLESRKASILMVQLSDSVNEVTVQKKSFRLKGDFLYIPSGTHIDIISRASQKTEFAFFELK